MGQRINIQYSVEMDDLTTEIGRLLQEAYNQHKSVTADCETGPTEVVLSYETLEKIDHIRLGLASIDHRLDDVATIIRGYLSYLAQLAEVPSEQSETPESLENKLTSFKKLMEATANKDEVPDQGN